MLLSRRIYEWLRRKHRYADPEHKISAFRALNYRVSQTRISSTNTYDQAGYVSTTEADSHADTFVAGKNCVPLHYTERSCDVQPYSEDYAPMKNVSIVTAATGYTSATGMNYILVFPEALYMPSLGHSLFNPNQLRTFGTRVQDNPFGDEPMSITNPDGSFTACYNPRVPTYSSRPGLRLAQTLKDILI